MRILVVDDEPQIRNICERALSRAGFEVLAAESGERAAPLLDQSWDIVLTDLTMPGAVDGIELLRRTRERTSADVILMTAYPDLDTALESMREGAYDYLIKPFTPDTLLRTVKRCAEKRELSRELATEKGLRAELTRMQRVRDAFGQFVTPEVADFALSLPLDGWKKGVLKTVTMLFADVRQFTPFAEGVPPEAAVETLNGIFSCIIAAVQREGGILNKFMGDGILALFGAPLELDGHERAGARAALEVMAAVEKLLRAKPGGRGAGLHLGIGINTGKVIAGCLGTPGRTEYSVIGHAVNLAARLEEAAGPGQILLGSRTAQALDGAFQLRREGPLELSGIAEPGPIWELIRRGD